MEELDAIPLLEDLGKAIDSLTCGKAPGNDGIPCSRSCRLCFCIGWRSLHLSCFVEHHLHSNTGKGCRVEAAKGWSCSAWSCLGDAIISWGFSRSFTAWSDLFLTVWRQPFNWRCVHAHKIRRQTIKHHKTHSKTQDACGHHQRHALCRWHSSHLTHQTRSTVKR